MKGIIHSDREDRCFLCWRNGALHVHHIFGGSSRSASDRNGLIVHLCVDCHELVHSSKGREAMDCLHRIGQQAYEEKIGTREQFREEFIRSYL